MLFQNRAILWLTSLVTVGILVLYWQISRNINRLQTQPRSVDQDFSVYYNRKEQGTGCNLFTKSKQYKADLSLQKEINFQSTGEREPNSCFIMSTNHLVRRLVDGTWEYHCTPLVECFHFTLLYVNGDPYRVRVKNFAHGHDLVKFLGSENRITSPRVYAQCTGQYHSQVFNHSCVKFPVDMTIPNVDQKYRLERKDYIFNASISKPNIQVIYLHFIARHQFIEWLPVTHDFMKNSAYRNRLFDFEKYQSVNSDEMSFLKTFLYGNNDSTNMSILLSAAKEYGFKIHLADLTCKARVNRTRLLRQALCGNEQIYNSSCGQLYYSEEQSKDLCSADHFVDVNHPAVEFALLDLPVSDQFSFTLNFISLADVRTDFDLAFLDYTISSVLKSRLNKGNYLTMVVSDLGYIFSSPSSWTSVHQTMFSNPALFLYFSKGAFRTLPKPKVINLTENQVRLISMIDIHYTLLNLLLISTKDRLHKANYDSIPQERKFSAQLVHSSLMTVLPANGTCKSMSVLAPNMCICQDQPVVFRNDTVQVGFSEFVLGSLNNRQRYRYEIGSSISKHFFQGITFFTPHLLSHGNLLIYSSLMVLGKYQLAPKYNFQGCVVMDTLLEINCTTQISCQITRLSDVFVEPKSTALIEALKTCENTLRKSFYPLPKEFTRLITIKTALSKSFGTKKEQYDLYKGCVFLIVSNFVHSLSFNILNVCPTLQVSLVFNLILEGLTCLTPLPVTEQRICPLELKFLTSVVQTSYYSSQRSVRYKARIEEISP